MTLLDTPGFNNTLMGETEATAGICAWTSLNCRERRLLSGIIYLHRTTNAFMGGSSLKSPWNGDFWRGLIVGVLLLKDSMAPEEIDLNYKRRTNFIRIFCLQSENTTETMMKII